MNQRFNRQTALRINQLIGISTCWASGALINMCFNCIIAPAKVNPSNNPGLRVRTDVRAERRDNDHDDAQVHQHQHHQAVLFQAEQAEAQAVQAPRQALSAGRPGPYGLREVTDFFCSLSLFSLSENNWSFLQLFRRLLLVYTRC